MYIKDQEKYVSNYVNNANDVMPEMADSQPTWPALAARGFNVLKTADKTEDITPLLEMLTNYFISFVVRETSETAIEIWTKELY